MSQLDRELLSVAGLKVSDIAALLRRSRQAIYTGLSDSRSYFSAGEIIAVVHEVHRRDSPQREALSSFIERNYSATRDLIVPSRIACSQLEHAARGADSIIIGFNGDVEQLAETSLFARATARIMNFQVGNVDVVAHDEWVRSYFLETPALRPRQILISSSYQHPLCFFLVVNQDTPRSFFVGRFSLGESVRGDARPLLQYIRTLSNAANP